MILKLQPFTLLPSLPSIKPLVTMFNPPRRPAPSRSSQKQSQNQDEQEPKPYDFVSFPEKDPPLERPAGHDRYRSDRLHGALHLTLEVQTALHISTGVITLGSDVGQNSIPLIKPMTQTGEKQLVIQGSSLKGCIRAIYEAITNSSLPVITESMKSRDKVKRFYGNKYPQKRKPLEIKLGDEKKHQLCPAGRVFGALNYQGLLQFSDARCIKKSATSELGFLRSLHGPDPEFQRYYEQKKLKNGESLKLLAGRKFYYTMEQVADKGEKYSQIQQASQYFTFETVIRYRNLKSEELGVLLIALGQFFALGKKDDGKVRLAPKLGGGKPMGMGTVLITIQSIQHFQNMSDRYQNLETNHGRLTGTHLQDFVERHIQIAQTSPLLEQKQLAKLVEILGYPSDRQPPLGNY